MNRPYFALTGLVLGMAGLVGCTVGPNYKRPAIDVPGAYRGAAPDASATSNGQPQPGKAQQQETQPAQQSLGDEKWWEVFQDKDLQDLIRTALKNNYDVRIAARQGPPGPGSAGDRSRRPVPFRRRRRQYNQPAESADRADSFVSRSRWAR